MSRRRPTLPQGHPCSTMGAGGLNFCVRNGNRWDPTAVATGKKPAADAAFQMYNDSECKGPICVRWKVPGHECLIKTKPHERLVLVSYTRRRAYTSSLSTWWSSRALQGTEVPGRSYLGWGFVLRCFQRLSLPDIATQRCHWRDNWITMGLSNPVLSY